MPSDDAKMYLRAREVLEMTSDIRLAGEKWNRTHYAQVDDIWDRTRSEVSEDRRKWLDKVVWEMRGMSGNAANKFKLAEAVHTFSRVASRLLRNWLQEYRIRCWVAKETTVEGDTSKIRQDFAQILDLADTVTIKECCSYLERQIQLMDLMRGKNLQAFPKKRYPVTKVVRVKKCEKDHAFALGDAGDPEPETPNVPLGTILWLLADIMVLGAFACRVYNTWASQAGLMYVIYAALVCLAHGIYFCLFEGGNISVTDVEKDKKNSTHKVGYIGSRLVGALWVCFVVFCSFCQSVEMHWQRGGRIYALRQHQSTPGTDFSDIHDKYELPLERGSRSDSEDDKVHGSILRRDGWIHVGVTALGIFTMVAIALVGPCKYCWERVTSVAPECEREWEFDTDEGFFRQIHPGRRESSAVSSEMI